jgi:MFS family permease
MSDALIGCGSILLLLGLLTAAVCQLPSNIALDFFGGPVWISFICLTWGAVAAGFAGIKSEATFLILRFLLGIFEAGAFPGMVYYITMFYPRSRTQVPMTAIVMGKCEMLTGSHFGNNVDTTHHPGMTHWTSFT